MSVDFIKEWQDVLEIKNGRDYKKVKDDNGEYPIYGSGGIMGHANDYICPPHTVIIGRKGSINNPIYVKTKFWNVDTAFGLVANPNYLYPKYLYYFCVDFNFEKLNTTVTIPSLTKSNLLKIKMKLPNIEDQKKIADILDKTQEIIDGHKKQLEELDYLIEATFYDMFGDPILNEKDWEKVPLSKKVDVIGGYAFKSGGYVEDGIPVIKIGNINSGTFKNEGISFWTEDSKLTKYIVYPNDIVISLTGTVGKDDYANVCVLPNTFPKYYLNQRNAKLEIKNPLNTRYLQYLLKDKEIKRKLTGISRGIRQANISNGDILNLIIPFPPLELQNKFAEIVLKIEEKKSIVKQSITESQNLFNSLMGKYFD